MRQYLQVQLLRDTDAMSMRHSLEVRTPLVDRELLRAARRVPRGAPPRGSRQAPAARGAAAAAAGRARGNRRKQGFTLPFDHWLRHGALPVELPEHPGCAPRRCARVARDFERGRVHWSRLWALLVLPHFLAK